MILHMLQCVQGVWMGLMTGSGCLSRVLGPVFVSYVYTEFGTIWTFSITTGMMFAAMVWLHFVTSRINNAVSGMLQGTKKETVDEVKMESCDLQSEVTDVSLGMISRQLSFKIYYSSNKQSYTCWLVLDNYATSSFCQDWFTSICGRRQIKYNCCCFFQL